jgi:uncharacterized membrane protein
VTGNIRAAQNALHGFYWSPALPKPRDLGALPDGLTINQLGVISGESVLVPGVVHAVLWSTPTSAPQDLGTLPGGTISYAYGINTAGQIVGLSDVP